MIKNDKRDKEMKMDEKVGKNRHLGCSHKKIFELCNS